LLKTHGPENFPLLSWELLEMQWILNHLIAMRGATETDDGYDGDSDEDGQIALQHEQYLNIADKWYPDLENLSGSCEVEESLAKESKSPSSSPSSPPSSPLAP
jgi:hypothetical protein